MVRFRQFALCRGLMLLLSCLLFLVLQPWIVPLVFGSGLTASTFSARQRFLVTSSSAAENVALGAWMEDIADRVERLIGKQIFFRRGEPLLITLVDGDVEATKTGRVIRKQQVADRRIEQRITVENRGVVDPSNVIGALSSLLLNRYILAYQDGKERASEPGKVPEWLAIGIAGNLFGEVRAENLFAVTARWTSGDSTVSPARVFNMPSSYMPVSQEDISLCSAVTTWILSADRAGERLDKAFQLLVESPGIPLETWVTGILGFSSLRDMEQEWDLWMASRSKAKQTFGKTEQQDLDALRGALVVKPEQASVLLKTEVTETIDIDTLVHMRILPSSCPLAEAILARLTSLSVGSEPSYRNVLELYAQVLRGICDSTSSPAESDREEYHEETRLLRNMLKTARDAHQQMILQFQQQAGKADDGT